MKFEFKETLIFFNLKDSLLEWYPLYVFRYVTYRLSTYCVSDEKLDFVHEIRIKPTKSGIHGCRIIAVLTFLSLAAPNWIRPGMLKLILWRTHIINLEYEFRITLLDKKQRGRSNKKTNGASTFLYSTI